MKRHSFGVYAALVSALFIGCSAFASVYFEQETTGDFGTIDQANVGPDSINGGNNYCAPTATMNSFIYLQNAYPGIYDNLLYTYSQTQCYYDNGVRVPTVPNQPPVGPLGANYDTDAAKLAGVMMTTPGAGTSPIDLVAGKIIWLNTYAPLVQTRFEGMGIYNNLNPAGMSWITVGQPTVQFLAQMLEDGEDVEIYMNPPQGGQVTIAHVMTLAGIDFDTATNSGTIDGIDPDGGAYFKFDISDVNGVLTLGGAADGNLDGLNYANYTMDLALAESPVPEPISMIFFGTGLVGVVGYVARRRKMLRNA